MYEGNFPLWHLIISVYMKEEKHTQRAEGRDTQTHQRCAQSTDMSQDSKQ